jgi:hypothetical protein
MLYNGFEILIAFRNEAAPLIVAYVNETTSVVRNIVGVLAIDERCEYEIG